MSNPMKGVSCVTRKGVEYWYAQKDGKKVYCGRGPKGRKIAETAKAKALVKQYEEKEISAGLKVKKSEFKTVTDLSNWYMTIPSTQEGKSYWRKVIACSHLLKFFGNKPINRIEGEEQESYRSHRKNQNSGDGTINYEIAILSAMYHKAQKSKKIPSDTVPGEFIKRGETNPRRRIADEEFGKLKEHADPDFKDILICGYESAMRSSEIINLTANQVHLDVQHISGDMVDYIDLGIFDTKTGARRTVPISASLKDVLERRLQDLEPDDYVFSDTKGKRDNTKVPHKLETVCKRAKILYGDKILNQKGERIGIVFHCLRHTRTSKWIEMGFSDEIVRRATGHKSLAAYQQYVKLDPHAVMMLVDKPTLNDKILDNVKIRKR